MPIRKHRKQSYKKVSKGGGVKKQTRKSPRIPQPQPLVSDIDILGYETDSTEGVKYERTRIFPITRVIARYFTSYNLVNIPYGKEMEVSKLEYTEEKLRCL